MNRIYIGVFIGAAVMLAIAYLCTHGRAPPDFTAGCVQEFGVGSQAMDCERALTMRWADRQYQRRLDAAARAAGE